MAWWQFETRADVKQARGGAWTSLAFALMFLILAVLDHFTGTKSPDIIDTLGRLILAVAFMLNGLQVLGLSKAFERIIALEEKQRGLPERQDSEQN